MNGRAVAARLVRLPGWLTAFAIGVTLCAVALAANIAFDEFTSDSAWALGYGIAAATLLGVIAAYPLRRRAPRLGPLPAHHWLQLHIYGGGLFILLVLMHSGFTLPSGLVPWALWLLSLWLVVSGLAGLLIQRWIPRALTSGLTTEVHYDRIPELVEAVRERVQALVADADDSVRRLYREELAPILAAPRPRLIYFIDITGGITGQLHELEYLRGLLGQDQAERLAELDVLMRTKLEMDAHYTLQRALRWWLYGHVPFSMLLVALVIWHIFTVFYY